ncbi:hypothetical protein T484DRAFT_1810938, partial [Baffinella frigidus]
VFFCLREDHNGEARFSLRLLDDGGGARGGVDASPDGLLTIRVLPVNQPPSFSLCCAGLITFWSGSSPIADPTRSKLAFAGDILMGNLDPAGNFDREAFQNASFFVLPREPPPFLSSTPLLDSDGNLSLTIVPLLPGFAHFNVSLIDDGAPPSERAPTSEPYSIPHTIEIAVVEAFATFKLAAYTSLLQVTDD